MLKYEQACVTAGISQRMDSLVRRMQEPSAEVKAYILKKKGELSQKKNIFDEFEL